MAQAVDVDARARFRSPLDAIASKTLGRRGMLATIAGSTLGLTFLMTGCADDAVDEAVQKSRADATLPDPKFTPSQTGAPLTSGPERAGAPRPDAAAAADEASTAAPRPNLEPAAPPAASTPALTPSAPPSGGSSGGGAAAGRAAPAAVAPAAPAVPAAPAPAPVAPAPVAPAPTPPAAAPTPPPPPPPPPGPTAEESAALHREGILSRTTFAPTPEIAALVASMGPVAYLEQQLTMQPLGTTDVLTGGHTLNMTVGERWQAYQNMGSDRPAREMRLAAVRRAVQNPGHLAELMVEFWSNHFSTYSGEDDKNVRFAVATDDLNVLRAHAMGRFSDLVLNNARSVTMLLYLDNYRSSGNQPNQNYAREIMELHVLGEANGYDEMDVEYVARILTGWGLAGRINEDGLRYEYQPNRHYSLPVDVTITLPDGTTSTFSTPGRTGPAGEQDGIDFINWLVRLPNAAQFIATKLVRRFVSDTPPPSLVASTAAVYLANDTQIVPVLRHILTSQEFITSRESKVRTPFELLVAVLKASGATIDPTWDGPASNTITEQLVRLGQDMWQWATPDGFPDNGPFWVSTQTMLRRWELAGRFGNRNLNGIGIDLAAFVPNPVPPVAEDLFLAIAAKFGIVLNENDLAAIGEYVSTAPDAPTAMIDLNRDLGDIIGLILTTPSFHYR